MAFAKYLNAPNGSVVVFDIPLGGSVIPLTVTVQDKRLQLGFRYHPGLKDEVKISLEGAKWDPASKQWSCRNSYRNWYVIADVWMNSDIYNRYFTPPPSISFTRLPLWENQKQGLAAAIYRRRMLYAGKVGTGKMLIAFAFCDHLMQILKTSDIWWMTSMAGFMAFDDLYEQWKPSFYPRVRVTFSGLPKEIERQQRPPRILIVDESTPLKTPNTIQTQATLGLIELMAKAYGDDYYVLCLTGTPEPKDISDWWSQLEVVQPGFLRERDIHAFKNRYAVQEEIEIAATDAEDGKPRRYKKVVAWKCGQTIPTTVPDPITGLTTLGSITLPDECGKLPKRMAGLVMRHDERDLPIEVLEKKYVILSGNKDDVSGLAGTTVEYCPELEPTEAILRVAETIANEGINALQVLGRHRQLADGFQYGDAGTRYGRPAKLSVLKRKLALHREHGRTIIYAAFTASIDKLVEEVQKEGWAVIRVDQGKWQGFGCPAEIRVFQDRLDHNYPIAFIAHPKSGGEAVTLTAADSMHFFSNTYQAKDRWQAEGRVRYKACTVYDYMYLPTDHKVYNNLRKKKNGSDMTLAEIRRLMWISLGKDPEQEILKVDPVASAAQIAKDEAWENGEADE